MWGAVLWLCKVMRGMNSTTALETIRCLSLEAWQLLTLSYWSQMKVQAQVSIALRFKCNSKVAKLQVSLAIWAPKSQSQAFGRLNSCHSSVAQKFILWESATNRSSPRELTTHLIKTSWHQVSFLTKVIRELPKEMRVAKSQSSLCMEGSSRSLRNKDSIKSMTRILLQSTCQPKLKTCTILTSSKMCKTLRKVPHKSKNYACRWKLMRSFKTTQDLLKLLKLPMYSRGRKATDHLKMRFGA